MGFWVACVLNLCVVWRPFLTSPCHPRLVHRISGRQTLAHLIPPSQEPPGSLEEEEQEGRSLEGEGR